MESGQAMTIDDIDMYRAAKVLIDKHDDQANNSPNSRLCSSSAQLRWGESYSIQ